MGLLHFYNCWKHQERPRTDFVPLLRLCWWLWWGDQFHLSSNSAHHISPLIFPWGGTSVTIKVQLANTALIFLPRRQISNSRAVCISKNPFGLFFEHGWVWSCISSSPHPPSPRTLRMLWQKLGLPPCSSHALWGWRQLWPLPGRELGRGSRVLAAEPDQGPRPAHPHPSPCSSRDLAVRLRSPPWALSCPALPAKGQRWWPPACTWLDLSAALWGGSGWLWPRPPTTGWWLAATPSPPAGKWTSWGPRGCGQTVSWQRVSITASPSWTSSYCQVSVSHPPCPPRVRAEALPWCCCCRRWWWSSFRRWLLNALKKVNDSS